MNRTNSLSVNSAESLPQNWYSIQQLAEWCGFDVAYLRNNIKSILSGFNFNVESKKFGKSHQIYYSSNVLRALKEYQLKNSGSNASKNKEVIASGNASYIQNKTINQLLDNPQALMQLVAESSKRILELQPKAEIYDRICNAETLKPVDQVASNLGYGRNNFFALMRGMGIFYYSSKDVNGKKVNLPKQEYKDRGYFVTKEEPYSNGDKDCLYTKIYITGKGELWLAKKLEETTDETAENYIEKENIEIGFTLNRVAEICKESVETIKNFCVLENYIDESGMPTVYGIGVKKYFYSSGYLTEAGKDHIVSVFYSINQSEKGMKSSSIGKAE